MSTFPGFDPEDEFSLHVADDRTYARRIALQILYEIDTASHPAGPVLAHHLNLRQLKPKVARYVQHLVEGVVGSMAEIDQAISKYAPDFPLDQLAVIDRNVLRIAIFEFAIVARTPVGAAIDEAVELAKLFGADNAPAFINGVLGSLADDKEMLLSMKNQADDTAQ